MRPIEWKDGELNYCAALLRTGGDSPRVPADAVDSYLEVQHAGARRDNNPDAAECITLLQMIRAQPDENVRSVLWRSFWSKANGDQSAELYEQVRTLVSAIDEASPSAIVTARQVLTEIADDMSRSAHSRAIARALRGAIKKPR